VYAGSCVSDVFIAIVIDETIQTEPRRRQVCARVRRQDDQEYQHCNNTRTLLRQQQLPHRENCVKQPYGRLLSLTKKSLKTICANDDSQQTKYKNINSKTKGNSQLNANLLI
jgi:hypothetical protein